MDKEEFLKEIKDNTLDELEYIYETQKDLYSEEEMAIIKNVIDNIKKKEREDKEKEIKKLLPKEIECPKCLGPNLFENEECSFCGAKLDKEKYYNIEYYNNYDKSKDEQEERSYSFQYVISFLIPLIGFILGAILMAKDEEEKVNIGKTCIILGIASMIISVIIIISLLN